MKEKLKIYKIGGKLIEDELKLKAFIEEFSAIDNSKILIHGGGNHASEISRRLGIKSKLIDGRRITGKDDLDIILMTYAGLINKKIVALLQSKNINALGLSGADANIIRAKKRKVEQVDYGFVGDITNVDIEIINYFLLKGIIPVFCSLSHDGAGQLLNTNADTIASQIAIAMSKEYDVELKYIFEKSGVVAGDGKITTVLTKEKYNSLKKKDIITDGMIAKIDNCFSALESNVAGVRIGKTKIKL